MNINSSNFSLYCTRAYESDYLDVFEYKRDVRRIKYIKILISKYKVKNILKERILLNHIISFFNVFKVKDGIDILKFYVGEDNYPYLYPFLIYLGYIKDSDVKDIELDKYIVSRLNNL